MEVDLQTGNGIVAGPFSVSICTVGELNYV